jgi:hypothetical protein
MKRTRNPDLILDCAKLAKSFLPPCRLRARLHICVRLRVSMPTCANLVGVWPPVDPKIRVNDLITCANLVGVWPRGAAWRPLVGEKGKSPWPRLSKCPCGCAPNPYKIRCPCERVFAPSQTPPSGPRAFKLKIGRNYRELKRPRLAFQFQNGAIKRAARDLHRPRCGDFNSKMVRLKAGMIQRNLICHTDFNSKMVRLKEKSHFGRQKF